MPNQDNTALASQHYENFPVASFALPKDLRYPIALIYHFARCADDFADEDNHTQAERLALLQGYVDELNIIKANGSSQDAFFIEFAQMLRDRKLPLEPFYDLLDAFKQDVMKARYVNFDEVLDYCKRSANPIGALLLHLFNKASPKNLVYSDNICSALQLINFYQDVAIDFDDTDHPRRIYCCQDEMQQFGITETQMAAQQSNVNWERFMRFNVERAETMLQNGKPLGRILPGRMGLEMRLIIAGGETIIRKLKVVNGDVFHKRPTIKAWDWPEILIKAI
ncbi:MAG: squalene synthase HpnC [Methylophilaceae bacterium]|jgi:squalene synthase HpnC|tara:strand:- start:27530 stop:28369 length:840 start_codon:yes stop_codon:yes gene_type:complete